MTLMMTCHQIAIGTSTYDVWVGGQGADILLLHGGWGGPQSHWSTVWDQLSRKYRIIAPEIPGVKSNFDDAPRTYDGLATWCASLMSILNARKAHVIGNSLGASIAWQMCARHPETAQSLVMVNGFPPAPLAYTMRLALKLLPLRSLAVKSMQNEFYSSRTINSAFVLPSAVPQEIREYLGSPTRPALDLMLDRMCSVIKAQQAPPVPTLFLWGEKDNLPSVRITDARRYQSMTPGARLTSVPNAGHLPQVDNPESFLMNLNEFLDSISTTKEQLQH